MVHAKNGSIARLRTQSATIREMTLWPDERLMQAAPAVSGWSPYEHADHVVKTAAAIAGGLLMKDLPPLKAMSWLGHAVLLTGYIPRGRAKAPSRVRPVLASRAELVSALDQLDGLLAEIASDAWQAPVVPCIPHPYFGGMTALQSLRFIGIHTSHHLAIVRDIERSRR